MFKKSTSFYLTYVLLLVCAVTVGQVACDEDEVVVVERDELNLTIPNPFGQTPLLETNNQNGRYIGIHIPILFDGVLHFRDGGLAQTKFVATFLSGLWGVTYDRLPGVDGQLFGPMKLTVLWMKVYDNEQASLAA